MTDTAASHRPLHVGVVTFHHVVNYGAVLQAWALCDAIRQRGHEPEILDYRPYTARRYVLRALLQSRWNPREVGRDAVKVVKFLRFIHHRLPVSRRTFRQAEGLGGAADKYDAVLTGSDQVWNTRDFGLDRSYFLGFVDPDQTRLGSYAPSAGATTDWGDDAPEVGALLRRFHHLSARDTPTKRLVSEVSGRDAVEVLDPTFLGRFDRLIDDRPIARGSHLLIYQVVASPEMERRTRELKEALGLPAVVVGGRSPAADRECVAVSPQRWLGAVKNADFVVTHSFHGTIFAILYRTPFLVVPHKSGSMRLADLLKRAGVSERLLDPRDPLPGPVEELKKVDFDEVHRRLAPLIKASGGYLDEVLQTQK